MTVRIHVTVASIATAVAAFAAVVPACAGGDKVAFPENHAAGVLFTTVDRPDNKQFRELYTSAEALDAAKKGEPLPSGTVITLIQYAAKLDAQGNPEKDANGRFIKGDGEAHGLGHRVPGRHPQRRMGVPSLQGGQEPEHRGQSYRLLQLPQAARQAGFRLPLRQAQGRGEIGPTRVVPKNHIRT